MGEAVEPSLMMFPPADRGDAADLWLGLGDGEEPSNRDRLIALTMREVALVGPASFNTATVCDTLGISYPMVNYYFGNRDGLMAEAAHATYVRYIDKLWRSVGAAPRDPEERLRAYLRAHRRLNVEIRGWGAVLNYPIFSATISSLLEERFGVDQRRHFELNAARLARLILDLWEGRVSDVHYTVDDYERAELLGQTDLLEAVAAVSWATLGVAVWNAGRHSPSRGVPELEQLGEDLVEAFVEDIIRSLRIIRPTEKPPAA